MFLFSTDCYNPELDKPVGWKTREICPRYTQENDNVSRRFFSGSKNESVHDPFRSFSTVKRELSKLQNNKHELETELVRLRESCGNSETQHAEEMAKTKATFEEEISALKEKQEAELMVMKSKVEAIEKENEELKVAVAKEKGEAERKENDVKERSGKEFETLQVELKKMQEENDNLKNELENAQKYVSELCILHLAR